MKTIMGVGLALLMAPALSYASGVSDQILDMVGSTRSEISSSGGGFTTVTLRPQQVRTYCSNSNVAGKYQLGGTLPNGSPCPAVPPAACPAANALPKLDLVAEIFGAYTPCGGGANTNTAGEGVLGYFNFGALPGPLNCDSKVPPTTACVITDAPFADCTAVLRYDLSGVPAGVAGAALDVQGVNFALWTTLSANVCNHRYIKGGIDQTSRLVDGEGLSPDPACDQPAINTDCIVDDRDGRGFISFVQVHDVLLHEGLDTHSTAVGGTTALTFRDEFPDLTFPLPDQTVSFIAAGGEKTADGVHHYVDIMLRLADPRGSLSEGPTAAAKILGIPNANFFIAEDDAGTFLNDPTFSAHTNLVLTGVRSGDVDTLGASGALVP